MGLDSAWMDILSGVGLFRTQTIPLTPNALNPHDEHREDRAELAWVNQPLDANKCSCRHMRCCEETNHVAGACTRSVETTVWTYRLEYFCSACRKYEWEAGRCLAQDSAQLTMARLSTEKVQGLKKVFTENAVVL